MESVQSIQSESVLDAVTRVCGSKEFSSKALLCEFLKFIVSETLAGRGEDLKGYTIGVEVMGKDVDFDPEQDSLVRIHAGRLRRSLKVYYTEEGRNDPIRIEIPKGAYRPVFFDVHSKSSSGDPVAESPSGTTIPPAFAPTVAVLPFKNLTGNSNMDYFALGFSEEISLELTNYEDFKVMSCWHRPETETHETPSLYNQLGSRFLVDGSVKMNKEQIKINVRLLDTVLGNQIWAERYTQKFSAEHLIDVEEDIAGAVARAIGSETGIIFQQLARECKEKEPAKFESIDAKLKFYHYEAHLSPELTPPTFDILAKAVSKEPDSGILNAMLASIYGTAYLLDFPGTEGALDTMAELAAKAMTLDPTSQIVRVVHLYKCFAHNERPQFFREADHCLSLNLSSPMRRGSLGLYLSLYGDWERGMDILDRVMNPSWGYPLFLHGPTALYYYRRGEYEAALNEAYQYDLPTVFWAPMLRAAALGQLGIAQEAGRHIDSLKQIKPQFERKAHDLIGRFVKEDALVAHVMEGLRKAGMTL